MTRRVSRQALGKPRFILCLVNAPSFHQFVRREQFAEVSLNFNET